MPQNRFLEDFAEDVRRFDGCRILVTGGTGFIGSWLCESIRIANRGLGTKIRFVACDRHLIFQGPFDAIIHLAPCDLSNIVNRAVEGIVEPILIASSGAVLHKPVAYLGGYATQKRADEDTVRTHRHGKIARIYSLIGPNLPSHLAAAQLLTMARAGGPIVVHSGGTSIRTYLWAGDLVAWLWAIFARGKTAVAYEVGGSSEVSIGELARVLGDVAGCSVRFEGEPTPGDRYVPDVSRTVAELGVTESVGLREALRLSL
jgi:nucleoside-diphosphate-sugar epimerase